MDSGTANSLREILLVAGVILTLAGMWQFYVLINLIAALPRKASVRAKAVLTANESEFYGRLRRALPAYDILPQVSMAALLEPTLKEANAGYWGVRSQFDRKIVDFVVVKRGAPASSGVIAVIELDDLTHNKEKDAARDSLLASAGIRTLRFESRQKPDERAIQQAIAAVLD